MIFRALRDFAGASVPCDGLVVSLYEREKQTRRVVYCWTDNEELELKNVIEVPVGEGITGKAIRSGTVIIDNNFKPRVGPRGNPVSALRWASFASARDSVGSGSRRPDESRRARYAAGSLQRP